jgi:hypothetical protein
MSVTSIGALPYPTAQLSSGPPGNWQPNRPNDQGLNNASGNTTNGATNDVTRNGAGTNAIGANAAGSNGIGTNGANQTDTSGSTGSTNTSHNSAGNADDDRAAADDLPPLQAATAPGTGQKVDIIV